MYILILYSNSQTLCFSHPQTAVENAYSRKDREYEKKMRDHTKRITGEKRVMSLVYVNKELQVRDNYKTIHNKHNEEMSFVLNAHNSEIRELKRQNVDMQLCKDEAIKVCTSLYLRFYYRCF